MSEEQKCELGEYWLEKSERSYKAAKNEYNEGNVYTYFAIKYYINI